MACTSSTLTTARGLTRWLLLGSLVSALILAQPGYAADETTAAAPVAAGPAPAALPVSPPVPGRGAATPETDPDSDTNTDLVEWVVSSAKQHGLKLRQWGKGCVRFITVGDPKVDLEDALQQANECLAQLEVVTGGQQTFIPKAPRGDQLYYLVLFDTKAQAIAFHDDLRAHQVLLPGDGADLTIKYPSFSLPHGSVASLEQMGAGLPEWSVQATATAVMDAFFARHHGMHPPTWLREGLAADMQHVICHHIWCIAIAYEDKAMPTTGDWYADIRTLIASGSDSNKTAGELLGMDLDALPNVFYEQIWSLATFIRQQCGGPGGARNRLRRIMELIAGGMDSGHAVSQVMGMSTGRLTLAWRSWAAER